MGDQDWRVAPLDLGVIAAGGAAGANLLYNNADLLPGAWRPTERPSAWTRIGQEAVKQTGEVLKEGVKGYYKSKRERREDEYIDRPRKHFAVYAPSVGPCTADLKYHYSNQLITCTSAGLTGGVLVNGIPRGVAQNERAGNQCHAVKMQFDVQAFVHPTANGGGGIENTPFVLHCSLVRWKSHQSGGVAYPTPDAVYVNTADALVRRQEFINEFDVLTTHRLDNTTRQDTNTPLKIVSDIHYATDFLKGINECLYYGGSGSTLADVSGSVYYPVVHVQSNNFVNYVEVNVTSMIWFRG